MKRKILVISTSGFMKKEGISTVIYDCFSRFDKSLFDIHLAIYGEYDSDYVNTFQLAGMTPKFLPSRKKRLLRYVIALFKLIKKEKYDVVYINGNSAIMTVELAVAKVSGCKVRVVHSHSTSCTHRLADSMFRPFFYKLYTDAIACGEKSGKWLFGERDYLIVKNGRDIDEYSFDPEKRKDIREKLGVSDDCVLIGHVGNFNFPKNHHFILYVFKEIKKKNQNSKLYLMGTGKRFDEIKQLAKQLKLDDVVFTGSITNVSDMLQAMDAMIFPSMYEGLPLVVIEWQIAALPSLISDTITRECAYSELVHFMSLDKTYDEWANYLLKIAKEDRQKISKDICILTKKNGFDINENVLVLQDYLMKRTMNNQNAAN